jgi:metallophosphoesterase superfamily enzyme
VALGSADPAIAVLYASEHPLWFDRTRRLEESFGATAISTRLREIACLEPWIRSAVESEPVAVNRVVQEGPLLVVGDLHGDLTSMARLVALWQTPDALRSLGIEHAPEGPAHIAFLGDLIDRGEESTACMALALQLKLVLPDRVTLLAGNHEAAVFERRDGGGFGTEVEPAGFADWLEGTGDGPAVASDLRSAMGRCAVALGARGPRAAIFEEGWILTHAGVPHEDALAGLECMEAVQRCPTCREDFAWIRLHASVARKRPNRMRKDCEMGIAQFELGAGCLWSFSGRREVRDGWTAVRGHDHPDGGLRVQHGPISGRPIVTVHSMCTEGGLAHAVLLRPSQPPLLIGCGA